MSTTDIERLLREIGPDAPCGDDLEYDPVFGEMERAAAGRPEQQIGETIVAAEEPDWAVVRDRASDVLLRSKDLRAAAHLCRALTATAGFSGLADGLGVVSGLLERYWDTLHPSLDPDDDHDPTLRMNTLAALADPDGMLAGVRRAALARSRALGSVALRDLDLAAGRLRPADGVETPDAAALEAIFRDADAAETAATAAAVRSAAGHLAAIDACLAARVGPARAPDLSALARAVADADRALTERLGNAPAAEAGTPPVAGPPAAAAVAPPGTLGSRDDVVRALDAACDWFRRHEPSSPVPLLLRRAQRLVAKDFLQIMRDMAPDGIAQAELVLGARDEADET